MKQTQFLRRLQILQGDMPLQPYASRLGVSSSHLSRVYRGERKPGFKLIRGALRAFPSASLEGWGLREID